MPKENKCRFAILGLLSSMPMSGYDIKKTCDQSIGYFWNENYGNIYPELKRLNEEELVTMTRHQQDGIPDKKEYQITETGTALLVDWIHKEPKIRHLREELLLQLYYGDMVGNDVLIKKVENRREICLQNCGDLSDIHETLEDTRQSNIEETKEEDGFDPHTSYRLMVIKFGQQFYQMELNWCNQILAELYKLQPKG